MTASNQNFTTYEGDAVFPVVTVKQASGSVADLSQAAEITWTAENPEDAAVLTKQLTSGGISLVKWDATSNTWVTDTGTAGNFMITIATGETSALRGDYRMSALLVDLAGNQSTVMTGTMSVHPR